MAKFSERIAAAWRGLTLRAKGMRLLTGRSTAAGVNVTPEAALQVMSVLTSVRLVAEAVSGLPVDVVVKRGRDRVPAPPKDAGLVRVLTVAANPIMDAAEFWRTVITWILLRGNAFVYVERDKGGNVVGLWPVPPADVTVKRTPLGVLSYKLEHDGKETWLPVTPGTTVTHDQLLHYRWFGTGPIGLSPIGVARQQVGIAVAATEYIGGFFERDATPATILTIAGNLNDKQWQRIVEQNNERHQGFEKSHNLGVYEGGAKLERISLSPADAQFLEVYKLSGVQIAAMYGVPPHKIGDLEHATFSNIEHQSIEFVQDALMPVINRLEKVTARLFTDPMMRLKFDANGRMRGDMATRTAFYAAGRQWGYLSANDIRGLEDESPIEGGDVYLEPINMIPAGSSPVQRDGTTPVDVATLTPTVFRAITAPVRRSPSEDAPVWVNRLTDALDQYVVDQRAEILGTVVSAEDRGTWDDLLAEAIAPVLTEIVADFGARQSHTRGMPFVGTFASAWVSSVAASYARGFNSLTFRGLDALEPDDVDVFDVFDAARQRATESAPRIVDSVASFATHEGAAQSGATGKTWEACDDAHAHMQGERADITATFSNGGRWPRDMAAGSDNAVCTCTLRFDYEEYSA